LEKGDKRGIYLLHVLNPPPFGHPLFQRGTSREGFSIAGKNEKKGKLIVPLWKRGIRGGFIYL